MIQKQIKEMTKKPGQARGVVFTEDKPYLLQKQGPQALSKVEQTTKEMGCHIPYQEISPLKWYPVFWYAVHLLAIKECFSWDDKRIFEMGNQAPKFSAVVKMSLKYFVSLKTSYYKAPWYWKKHFTVGKITLPEFHEEEKWLIVRLNNFNLHPICCVHLKGYFLRIAQYVIKSPKIEIKETKCQHKGDPYHDFLFVWR